MAKDETMVLSTRVPVRVVRAVNAAVRRRKGIKNRAAYLALAVENQLALDRPSRPNGKGAPAKDAPSLATTNGGSNG